MKNIEAKKCTFIVRNLSQEVQDILGKIAKERGISREQLSRDILADAAGIENSVKTRKYYKNKDTQKQAQ